jgi:iron complex outermembrane receptor protein
MDYYLENADKVSIHGIEIDSIWKFSGGWNLLASYGLTKSEFKKVSALSSLVGKQLPFIPDQSLSVSIGQKLENGLSYNIGSRTIGNTYFWDNTGVNTADLIDTYTLIDAKIHYAYDDWDFSLFGTNLTDEEYYTSLVSNLGFGNGNAPGIAGSPRVIGLSISKEF